MSNSNTKILNTGFSSETKTVRKQCPPLKPYPANV